MAIVEMTKIKLVALSEDRERLLNALHKTGCVQISDTVEQEETKAFLGTESDGEIADKYIKLKNGVEFLSSCLEKFDGVFIDKTKIDGFKNFFCSYDEFITISSFESEAERILGEIEGSKAELNAIKTKRTKLINQKSQIAPYLEVEEKFSTFSDTKTTKVYFGTIKSEQEAKVVEAISQIDLAFIKVLSSGQNSVITVVVEKNSQGAVEQIFAENGFAKCSFSYDLKPKEKLSQIELALKDTENEEKEIFKKICSFSVNLKNLKILCDYYKFSLEKQERTASFRYTGKTFILEGYLPAENKDRVKEAINGVSTATFIEFSTPTKEDNPPTLLRNNKVIKQSEFIIDLYSPPNYRESDPTKITFFFFMLFMGLIMADVGYGIMMIALGLVLARRIKVDNGARRLWNVIATGGFFAIIFGVLFNSFFGFALPFYNAILPSPVPSGAGTDSLMAILLLCLGLGVFQIAVGYLWKAINCFKQKDVLGGIFDGLIWVLFFIGFVFGAFNFLVGYLIPDAPNYMNQNVKSFFDTMTIPGLIMVGVALLLAMLTAGRNEKGFGHFSKGFGALYGIINIMSDILSYARLFGLMLSGMIIAQTFNDMGVSMLLGGGAGYALGPIILIVGHAFNFAMGVLGAYIHDSRLQYIEFFGKFYTGEGEKFMPLGSKLDYIYLTK